MKFYIATPCAHDQVVSHYAASVFRVGQMLAGRGIAAEIGLLGFSDLEVSRSVLASRFLAERSFTHLLFVDSDMSFESSLVRRMIELDEDFVGAMYAKRQLDVERLIRHARANPAQSPQEAVGRCLDYVGAVTGAASAGDAEKLVIQVRNGFTTAGYVGMGLCLLKRHVFEEMVGRGVVTTDGTPSRASPWPVPFYPFFDKEHVSISEDASFCRRWTRDCGGTIWACVDEALGHHGNWTFAGRYIEVLRAAGG